MADWRIEVRDFANRKVDFAKLSKRAQRVILEEGMDDAVKQLVIHANLVRNTAIDSMRNSPPDTTRARFVTRSKKHFPSFPFNPPRPDSGDLVRSILVSVDSNFTGVQVRVGSSMKSLINKPPYPLYLEFGTERMAPRPWLDPAYQKHKDHAAWKVKMSLINAAKRVFGP